MFQTRKNTAVRRLRIIVLSVLCRESGSQLRARYIAHSLERAGAQVVLISGAKCRPFGLNYLVSLLTNFRLLFYSTDVIVGLKPLPNVTLLMLVKKWLGTMTVIDIDDIDYGYRKGWLSELNCFLQKSFPKKFDLVTYHNDRLREFIINTFRVGEENLYKLSQGVDTGLYRRDENFAASKLLSEKYDLNGKKVVAYTGHLNIACDLDTIFRIVKIVGRRFPEMRLLVAGGGPMERHFRNLAKTFGVDKITIFTGYLSPEEVVSHLMLADVGIVYYKEKEVNLYRESMKLREMLSMGIKVVCNDFGDLKVFSDFTYQTSSNLEDVAAELTRILANGGDMRESNGAVHIRRCLDWQRLGAIFFEKLITVKSSRVKN